MPWIVLDWKRDELFERIPRIEEIDITEKPPRARGLYIARPLPHEELEVDQFMWRIWERGRTGVFVDEGYMIGRFNRAYRALLTQGRSKRIPIITLSQRPAWISPFILSESDFVSTFYLYNPPDVKRVAEWMPGVRADTIPRFHSYMHDVKRHETAFLAPCPDADEILNRFDLKLGRPSFI
jgi:hypothetical protein